MRNSKYRKERNTVEFETSDKGTDGFSRLSPSTMIPVPWHSGQNTEWICAGAAFLSPSTLDLVHLGPFFLLDLLFAFGFSN